MARGADEVGPVIGLPATVAAEGRPRPLDDTRGVELVAAFLVLAAAATLVAPMLLLPLLGLPPAALLAHRSAKDAVTLLTGHLLLLLLLPATLVVPGLGAAGRPALLAGLAMLGLCAVAPTVPALGLRMAPGPQPLRWALFGLVATTLLSYVLAPLRVLDALERSALDRGLLIVLSAAGVAAFTAAGVPTLERLERLLGRLVVAGAAVAAIAWAEFALHRPLGPLVSVPGLVVNERGLGALVVDRSAFLRASATAAHPIELSVVCAALVPLALLVATRTRHPLRFLPAALLAGAVPMTVSRSGVLCLCVAGALALPAFAPRTRLNVVVGAVVFVVALRAAAPGLLGTVKSLFTFLLDDPSTQTRLTDYEFAGQFIARSPLVGRGFQSFLPQVYDYLDNQFLLTLVETGVLGVAALLGVFAVATTLLVRVRRRAVDPAVRGLATVLRASLLGVLVSFATFDSLSFSMLTGVLFLLLGSAAALWRLSGVEGGPHGS